MIPCNIECNKISAAKSNENVLRENDRILTAKMMVFKNSEVYILFYVVIKFDYDLDLLTSVPLKFVVNTVLY